MRIVVCHACKAWWPWKTAAARCCREPNQHIHDTAQPCTFCEHVDLSTASAIPKGVQSMKITKTMIKENPVEAALAMAHRAIAADPEQAKRLLVEKRKDLLRLQELKSDLLPVELDNAETLHDQIRVLQQDIKTLISQLVPSPVSLPIFDLECLTWRDNKSFPRLVPFSVDSNKISFGLHVTRSRGWRNSQRIVKRATCGSKQLPTRLTEGYKDVFKTLAALRKPGKSIEIAAVFSGAIPDHIRDLISGARSAFDDLRIVAEVQEWAVIERRAAPARSRKGDPLLIGYDGNDYRLLAAFDTTSIEQIAMERSKGRKQS